MRRYKITEFQDGHCVVKIKEGWWPFWQSLWDYNNWDITESTYKDRATAQQWVDEDQAYREVKSVTKHP